MKRTTIAKHSRLNGRTFGLNAILAVTLRDAKPGYTFIFATTQGDFVLEYRGLVGSDRRRK